MNVAQAVDPRKSSGWRVMGGIGLMGVVTQLPDSDQKGMTTAGEAAATAAAAVTPR